MDFFHHEMLKAAFFGSLGIPLDFSGLLLDLITVQVIEMSFTRSQFCELKVANEIHVASVFQNCRDIRSHIGLTIRNADDHRAVFTSHPDFAWIITEHQLKSVGTTAFEKYADVYAQNSDLVGWISIPGTRIDYPVMQTKDTPNFYLKHAFDKSYSSYGVPYMQENCDVGISDNLVLYGHHMNNGSMFSDLCKYESEDFYREHKTIRFDTLDSFGEYEVIAAFKTVAYSEEGFKYYHFVRAEQEEDFDEFIAKCKELALYDTGVTAEYGDQLITLSTCEYSRTNGRMVVVARLLEE